jgi:Uncharacterised protein family UPF0547
MPYAVSMSSPGQPFTYSVLVPTPPAGVMQSLLSLPASGNYFDGYEVRQVTWNSFHVTRRYVPVWAIAVAIAGAIIFLIGLLALLVRETEVLTVTVYEQDEGSYLDFSGVAAPRVAAVVNRAVDVLVNGTVMAQSPAGFPTGPSAAFPATPAPAFATRTMPAPSSADSKICPECAEAVRAAARSCRFCGYRFSTQPT